MCGIVGYVGPREALPLLMGGLRRLEYRGYDSAGVAVQENGALDVLRAEGKLDNLAAIVTTHPTAGHTGIGHTRWATHGRPSEQNAHPHVDCGGVVLVGYGDGEHFLASDAPAILEHTRRVSFLDHGEVAISTKDAVTFRAITGEKIDKKIETITWDPIAAAKSGYKHFLLKEIS